MVRYTFDAECIFNKDGGPTAAVSFYEALKDAPSLEMEHAIGNPFLEIQDGYQPPVGIIIDSPRKFTGRMAPAAARGLHQCGTAEDFAEGGHYDPSLPPVEYRTDGLPVCCGAANEDALTGGFELGGSLRESYRHYNRLTGGFELGGSLRESLTYRDTPGGGYELGGSLREAMAYADTPAGGLEAGGAVAESIAYDDELAGGLEIGGPLLESVAYADVIGGGLEAGGAVAESIAYADVPAGGLEAGGAVAESIACRDTPGGGLELGGPLVEGFTPPAPAPGSSCATAGVLTAGVPVAWTLAAGSGDGWFKMNIVTGTQYHVRVSGATNPGTWILGQGTSCSSLIEFTAGSGNGCQSFTASLTGIVTWRCPRDATNPRTGTIVADTGPC